MDPRKETREEFEARYTAASKGPGPGGRPVVFGKDVVSMPCTCEDGGGPTHWAAIHNTPEAIKNHLDHEECLAELRAIAAAHAMGEPDY